MIKLNLLPPAEKTRLKWKALTNWLVFFGGWFGFFLAVFTALLLGAFFSLSILLNTQKELIQTRENTKQNRNIAEIEKKVKQVNQDIEKIRQKQESFILWTPLLEEISQITPSGVYLTRFYYYATSDRVELRGWAEKREYLLKFEDALKKSPYFTKVESPLSNLIKQKEINFSFTLTPLHGKHP